MLVSQELRTSVLYLVFFKYLKNYSKRRRQRENLAVVYNCPTRGSKESRARLFSEVHSSRTRGSKCKLERGTFHLDAVNFILFYSVSKSLSLERCSGDSTGWIPEQPDAIRPPWSR